MASQKIHQFLPMLTLLIFCVFPAEAYQYNKHSVPKDQLIKSPNYPSSYPPHCNVTWQLELASGRWGVVFKDFQLDSDSESLHGYDWLEIVERSKRILYTAQLHPLLYYISEEPQLTIHFVSDGLYNGHTRGFQLQVLYGANDSEVRMKIHEATKLGKSSREETSGPLLVTLTAVLTFVAIVIVVVVVVIVLKGKRCQDVDKDNRDAFGVRRNSGISHSRRTRSTDEAPPNDGHLQSQQQQQLQQQQQQQSTRVHRPVQRSNSQLNWMARAELATSMQKTGMSRPNAYTSTKVCPVDCQPCTSSNVASNTNRNNLTRSYDSSLNEYCDTVDTLNSNPGPSRILSEVDLGSQQQPPSYEESYLVTASNLSHENRSPTMSPCYENACSARQHFSQETNIYINAVARSGSRGSINEITIGASNCVITATCGDHLEDKPPSNKSAFNLDVPATNIVIYQNVSANAATTNSRPPSSSIQIIDGYAFIVPSSTQAASCGSPSQQSSLGSERGTSCRDAPPGSVHLAGFIRQQSCTDIIDNVYSNTHSQTSDDQ